MGYEMDTVGVQGEVSHVRWVPHSAGAHSWASCLRWQVPRLLAHLFTLDNPVFQDWECKEKRQEAFGWGVNGKRMIGSLLPYHLLIIL